VILRIDTTLSRLGGPDTIMHMLHDAAEAAALGADMVVVNCYLGVGDAAIEARLLEKLGAGLGRMRAAGHAAVRRDQSPGPRYADPKQASPTSEDLALAMRFGLEYGCDMVKTVYNGDRRGTRGPWPRRTCPSSWRGAKGRRRARDLPQLKEAMTHGACGAAVGRRVWGSPSPARSSTQSARS